MEKDTYSSNINFMLDRFSTRNNFIILIINAALIIANGKTKRGQKVVE